MTIAQAQEDVRTVFLRGAVGQAVSGAIWWASAAAAALAGPRLAIQILVLGGMFIFPLTQGVLRLTGRRASLERGHPMNGLAMQVAFTLPLTLPLAGAAALYRLEWFYPAVMVLLGAHYLPFVFLYGMPAFALLGGSLLAAGFALALLIEAPFAAGAWLTGALLLGFAIWAAATLERAPAEQRA